MNDQLHIALPGDARPMDSAATLATAENCTKCNLCQAHCPVLAVTERFPGPKYAGPQAARFRLIEAVAETAPDLCTGCGVCTSVCPNDVAVSDIITLAKSARAGAAGAPTLGQRVVNRPDMIGQVGALAPWLANRLLGNPMLRRAAEVLLGVDRRAPLPRFSGKAFRRWMRGQRQPDGPVVSYFTGCAVEHFDAATGMAVVAVLNHMGYRVELPSARCCALPMLSNGEQAAAATRARRLVADLAGATARSVAIVASSTSCGMTLKSKYAAYLDMTDGDARAVASSVRDVCEFVRDLADDAPRRPLGRLNARVFYHPPCQLRGQRIGFPALELLRRVEGLEVVLSESACCGIGGTYGYDRKKHDISRAIAGPLVRQVEAAGPDFVVCDSETCRWHLQAMTGLRALHPMEVVRASLEGRGL